MRSAGSSEHHCYVHLSTSVGEHLVAVEHVVEVIPALHLDRQEQGGAHYLGILHYRGRVVPVFDLGVVRPDNMDSSAPAMNPDSFLLVLRSGPREFALLAFDVIDIVHADAGAESAVDIGAGRVVCMVQHAGRALRVLSPEHLAERFGFVSSGKLVTTALETS